MDRLSSPRVLEKLWFACSENIRSEAVGGGIEEKGYGVVWSGSSVVQRLDEADEKLRVSPA